MQYNCGVLAILPSFITTSTTIMTVITIMLSSSSQISTHTTYLSTQEDRVSGEDGVLKQGRGQLGQGEGSGLLQEHRP